jgi:hypothetical protein
MKHSLLLSIVSLLIIAILCTLIIINYNRENYSPIITRYANLTKDNNICDKPFTNSKRDSTCSKPVYTYQYANRFLLNASDYDKMVSQVLKDLSTNSIDINSINSNLVIEDYNGDPKQIIDFFNEKLKQLVLEKPYLQQNGNWKYEQFYISDPIIYYYSIKEQPYNIMKVIYTLGNPLRSSYTNCYAFLKVNSKYPNGLVATFEIINTDTVTENNIETNIKESLTPTNLNQTDYNFNKLKEGELKHYFLNTMPEINMDQWAHPTDNSGINYIAEYREGTKLDIKPEIPNEFKNTNTFKPQHLPPLFGNGVCDYPPIYKKDNKKYIVSSPPTHH